MSELDESAEICLDEDGNPEPDTELRDYENVPFKEDIHAYFEREVRPHVADAWIDESKTRVGYGDRRPKKHLPCRSSFRRDSVEASLRLGG
jgi:type I restriction enzyme M protein